MEVVYYELPDGARPAEEFIFAQHPKMQAKLMREIRLLALFGAALREPHSKHLDDGIFEIRAVTAGASSRVLYFFVAGDKAVLTNGFAKKTQQTPRAEIERAQRCREDYLTRGGKNGEVS